MPTTDPRLGLITPIGSDNVVELRTAIANHAATLSGSVLYSEGTFAARPAAGTAGRVYGGTDTGLYYFDTGSVWLTTMFAGAWQALVLNINVSAVGSPSFTPSARRVGDTVQFKGALLAAGGGTFAWGAVPSVCFPTGTVKIPVVTEVSGTFSAAALQIDNTGAMLPAGSGVPSATILHLDGISYPLS